MGTLACPLCCDNKFSSRLSLKHHLLEIESKIQCPDCCERFHSILELANHLDGQCWKPTEVIEIKNEVLDTKEFSEGDYKSEDGQIAGNIADDSNSCLQEVESVISGLTEESTSQMAIDPLENMDVMIKSEVDSDSEDSLSFKAEMDVENVEECKIDEPSSHQQFEGFIIQQTADTQRIAEGNSADCKLPKNVLHVTKKRYRQVYDQFCSWRNLNHIDHVTEDVMLSYMYYLSKTLKCCSSLWSKYSMIKSMLLVHENLNISHYNNVKSFLKKQSTGYRPTQSKTLSRDEVNRFMSEASDEEHLLTKVVAMIGIAAGCRREELYGMLLGDVEDTGSVLFITIAGKPNHMRREFIIANDIQGLNFLELFRKYVSLRPKNCDHDFLFVGYRKGRCISQRVGIHTIGGVPKKIASFLGLANPETYTAHCFRLSSSVIRARTY